MSDHFAILSVGVKTIQLSKMKSKQNQAVFVFQLIRNETFSVLQCISHANLMKIFSISAKCALF